MKVYPEDNNKKIAAGTVWSTYCSTPRENIKSAILKCIQQIPENQVYKYKIGLYIRSNNYEEARMALEINGGFNDFLLASYRYTHSITKSFAEYLDVDEIIFREHDEHVYIKNFFEEINDWNPIVYFMSDNNEIIAYCEITGV